MFLLIEFSKADKDYSLPEISLDLTKGRQLIVDRDNKIHKEHERVVVSAT